MAISLKKEGNVLVIRADLDGTELSYSGKNINLATTNGFVSVENAPEIKVSLNVITKPKRR
jgi:hypothetical protein